MSGISRERRASMLGRLAMICAIALCVQLLSGEPVAQALRLSGIVLAVGGLAILGNTFWTRRQRAGGAK